VAIIALKNLLIFLFKIDFFFQISYRDIQYKITALKRTIKTSIKLIKFLLYDIKRYNSFDRCKLPVWCQSDEITGRDNRDEIMTITSILIGHFNCSS